MKARVLMAIVMALAMLMAALAAPPAALAAPPDVSGTTWVGWTDHGSSIATGVWARGGKLNDYQIYSVVFVYDSANPVAGTSSGFVDGDKILGIGIKNNSGTTGYPVIKLDPNNNSYYPDSTGSAGDGKSSFSTNGDLGDSVIQFGLPGGSPSEITIRSATGSGNYYLPNGGNWGGPGQPGFRGINPASGVWKVFFDLDQMTTEFGPGGTRNATGPYLGAFGSAITFATGGLGGTEAVVQNISTVSAVLSANTTDSLICIGETTTVNIDIANVVGLWGYQFEVNYNSTSVTALGNYVNSFFDTTTNSFVVWNADCTSTPGTCKFSVSKQQTNPPTVNPSSGSGRLAQIVLTANPGPAPVTFNMAFSNDVLSDVNGAPLAHNVSAPLPITVCGLANISGFVTLQGRFNGNVDAGTVTMIEQAPTSFAPVAPVPFSSSTGAYSIQVPYLPGGSSYKIRAEHGLYLGNEETFLVTGSLSNKNTRLWGGDANNDGKVKIGDLSCIGAAFGISPIVSDCGGTGSPNINKDAVVNIQDLSIAGGNFDKCSYQPWNTALPANYACTPPPLAGHGVHSSVVLNYSDGGWGGWSCPAGQVIVGGGFEATAPVAVSAPGTPGSVWPHYTFGASEYGWVVRDAPDGVSNTITIHPICAYAPPGYQVVKSAQLNYSGTGWGGWSCPVGKVVTGGGFELPGTVLAAAPGTPGSIWPHYTFGANEYGWVAQAGGVGGPSFIYAICASPVSGYEVVNSSVLGYSDSGWGGWSCPAGKFVTSGGFKATAPVAVSAPATPNSVWPHYSYGPAEYGWVVRDYADGAGSNTTVYAVCALP